MTTDTPVDELLMEALRRTLRCLEHTTLASSHAPSLETNAVMKFGKLVLAQKEGQAVDAQELAAAIGASAYYAARSGSGA